MPGTLKQIAECRHQYDMSSLRVILVPLHSNKDSRVEIDKSVEESVISCIKYLDEFCVKNHLSKLRKDTGHSCAVELLMPPKVPALSVTNQTLVKVTNSSLIAHLENEASRTRAIHSTLGRFKQHKRMIMHNPNKDSCYLNPKDENYLRNFKTSTGERGTLENLKDLIYLQGVFRRNFTSFLIQIATVRHAELRIADNYMFLMERGLAATPPEAIEDKSKRARSSSAHGNRNPKNRRGNRDPEDDLRDKLNSDRNRGLR